MSLPYVPCLPAETRRVTGVPDRQVGLLQDLGRVERGQRHLRGPHQVELVRIGDVDVDRVRRQEAAAEHGLLAHEHRRDHRDEIARLERVERVANQRELHLDDVAQQVDEPGSAGAHAALGVHDAEELSELGVVARLEVERRRLADAPDLDRVFVREPVGRGLVRDVRRAREQVVQLALGLLELGFERPDPSRDLADLGDQARLLVALGLADRLARAVLFGAELLDPHRELASPLVELEQAVDGVGQVAPGQALSERLRVLPDRADVEHLRPWPRPLPGWRPPCPASGRPGPAAGP